MPYDTASPSDPFFATLALSLHLSATPLEASRLALVSGQPEENVRLLLRVLQGLGLAVPT